MLRRNAALRITALLLAVFLWFYVRLAEPVTRVEVYRTVPVVLRTTGSAAGGHRIARIELEPSVVSIAGDDAAIRRVTYVETEPLDLGRADAPISRAVRLVTPRGVTALGAQRVAVEIEIVEE